MLAVERRNAILTKLINEKRVLVNDLSRTFSVTEETIRRDLEKLDNKGLAKKTYGGAVLNNSLIVDLPFQVRKQSNIGSKQYIAEIISNMISDGDCIMLDASSTALWVAKSIMNKKSITLITNSINILYELRNNSDWKIICTGGIMKQGGLSLVGYQTIDAIKYFNADIAICSAKGIDCNSCITDSNDHDAQIKKTFFRCAKKKILAIDDTKFDKVSFTKVCDLNDIDIIVTNKQPSENWETQLNDHNIEVLY